MNKNTFSNRVTWYNFILCIFVVWIHAQNTDLFTEVVMIEGKPLFNQIEQTIVWQFRDFLCVQDTCFTEIIPGGKCWKNIRRGLWGCLSRM